MMEMEKIRYGFAGPNQLPFFMLWREYWYAGEVVYAEVIYLQEGLEP